MVARVSKKTKTYFSRLVLSLVASPFILFLYGVLSPTPAYAEEGTSQTGDESTSSSSETTDTSTNPDTTSDVPSETTSDETGGESLSTEQSNANDSHASEGVVPEATSEESTQDPQSEEAPVVATTETTEQENIEEASSSSAVVTEIVTPGGDDSSYRIPLDVSVIFNGVEYTDVYATTNSTITFGSPDGTYWDYPMTPSISIESRDWWALPSHNPDMYFIIRVSEGGFQVDGAYLPYGTMTGEVTNIIITAQILTDGTVSYSYSVDGPLYGGERTGARLNDGTVVSLEDAGIQKVDEPVVLEPTPVEPEPEPEPEPEEPVEPEQPVEPETPVEPEPEQPVEPSEPGEESPQVPEVPNPTPTEPENPHVQPEPENPQPEPESPSQPEQPTEPEQPEPENPVEPENPSEPPLPENPTNPEPEEPVVEPEPQPEVPELPVKPTQPETSQPEKPKPTPTEPAVPGPEPSPKPTPESVIKDALADGKLSDEEKASIVSAILEDLKPGEAVSSQQLFDAGLTYSDLPPDTPVDVRTDENGNPVVITAEIAAALLLLENPAELLSNLFSDPGQVLLALSNIGADMSPEERRESEQVIVASVIVGQIAAAAAAAGAAGSAGGSGSTSGGSGSGAPTGGPSSKKNNLNRRRIK